MVDFIAKPIDPQTMTEVLLKWVNPRRRASPVSAANPPATACGGLPVSLPGFDLAGALQRLDGNRSLLARLLADFAETNRATPSKLEQCLQAGDKEAAATLLHTLKGVAGNLGAQALAEAARKLEAEIRGDGELGTRHEFRDVLAAALAAIDNRPGPRPAAAERSIDRQALAALLQRLSPILSDHELVPLELLEELNRFAAIDLPGAPLARLLRQIDHFDYDGALTSVTQLLTPLIM